MACLRTLLVGSRQTLSASLVPKYEHRGRASKTTDVLSIFHDEAVNADMRAFATLMAHIKEIDESHSTVLMFQVENEVDLLGNSRDCGAAANTIFSKSVPHDLITGTYSNPHLKSNLSKCNFSSHSRGSWT